jgi:obg-like ATPase 1
MSKKKNTQETKKPLFGRVKNHLKMGVVGLPNVGKSSLFNLMTKCEVKADNYPFCIIEPNTARVGLPDDRWEWLCKLYKPASKVPGYLEVVDIAGLVKGASEGEGLGNAFLSHIGAVDGIYHVVRIFESEEITHVEGHIDPVRDLEIISNELRLKDLDIATKALAPVKRVANADPKRRAEVAIYEKIIDTLESGKDIRAAEWTSKEIEALNELLLLTAKPVIYLINMGQADYLRQKSKWLGKIAAWVKEHSPGSSVIPCCVEIEDMVFGKDEEEKKKLLEDLGTKSVLDKIIQTGYSTLNLISFFTCGADEVKSWPLQLGFKAP